nr:myb-like protein X [Ipomoea batatas]
MSYSGRQEDFLIFLEGPSSLSPTNKVQYRTTVLLYSLLCGYSSDFSLTPGTGIHSSSLIMFRQSPTNRNHRSKGLKSKHILQFCLLLVVCFWLIYQVKRSHEKRKEFDDSDSKFSLKMGSSFDPTMWGRKDDIVDEHNQEKSGEEVEQEEEFVDDEKDREVDETDMKNSQDHELDEDSRSTHEAQEELYKADDASSAVTHDTQTVTIENENGGLEAANENAEVKNLEHESNPDKNISFVQHTSLLKLDDHETTGSNSSLNTTSLEESIPKHVSLDSKNTSIVNLRSVVESNNTEVSGETHDVSLQNLTQSSFDSTIDGNVTTNETAGGEDSKLPTAVIQQGNHSAQIVDDTRSDSNSTSIQNEDSNSTSVNATQEDGTGDKSHSSGADTSNEVKVETSETADKTGGIDERLESSNIENLGEIVQDLIDPSDTSIPLEEKEVVDTDLETLPDIQTEGRNTEDVAAE